MIDAILIGRMCHEINRAYCEALGDFSQVPWEDAPEWQRKSCIDGVRFHLENPDSKPSDSHENWMAEKKAAGWCWGKAKNVELKVHPCFMPYEDLPIEQQVKDHLFLRMVRLMENE